MPDFIVSIDLGQTTDPTALAVLKRSMLLKDGVPVRSNKGGILSRFTFRTCNGSRLARRTPALSRARSRSYRPHNFGRGARGSRLTQRGSGVR